MPGDPEAAGPPGPAQDGPAQDRPAQDRSTPDRPAVRRRPRRATGGTFSGAEPRLAGLTGPASGDEVGDEVGDEAAVEAHEDWLRAQRPPHWG
ncbi:hypothetical protein [Kocuria sp. KH4]